MAAAGEHIRKFFRNSGKGLLVDIADEDLCAVGAEGTRKLAADAGGARRYQYTLRHDSECDKNTLSQAGQRLREFARTPRSHIGCENQLTSSQ
jgi:hypothetical protein